MGPLTSLQPLAQLGTRGRDDEFARVLDGTQPAGTWRGAGLARRLSTAGVDLAPVAAPRSEFRAALRTRLLAVAAVQAAAARTDAEPAVSWRTSRPAPRGLGVAAGAMACLVAVGGVAVAGSQSLPGDPFYGVKRTAEAFQLATADGDLEKGSRHLDFAATRLGELRGLTLGRTALDRDVAQRVHQTLADMDAETRKGSALLTSAFHNSQALTPLRALSQFATRQSDGLERLLPVLPPDSRDRAVASLALVTAVADESESLLKLGTCGPACDPATAAPPAPAVAPPSADPGQSEPGPDGPCGCEPTPTPYPHPSAAPDRDRATASPAPADDGESSRPQDPASPQPSPEPSPSPSPSDEPEPEPLPVPLPVPLPSPLPSVPIQLPIQLPLEVPF